MWNCYQQAYVDYITKLYKSYGIPVPCAYGGCLINAADAVANKNTSAVIKNGKITLEERCKPKAGPQQVVVEMITVGLNSSDSCFLYEGKSGPYLSTGPIVTGQDGVGVINEVGPGVHNLKVGDKVVIEPFLACTKCTRCTAGEPHLCEQMKLLGSSDQDGCLSRYILHCAERLHKIPKTIQPDEAVLIHPLSIAVHSCRRGGVNLASNVVVFGAGHQGILSVLVARALGATNIVVVDLLAYRLTKAKALGAHDFILADKEGCPELLRREIVERLGNIKPDVAIETTGDERIIGVAMRVCGPGGHVVLTELSNQYQKIPVSEIMQREVNVHGIYRANNEMTTAIELVKAGKINVKPLISHHFKLDQIQTAIQYVKNPVQEQALKVLVHIDPKWKPCNKCG